MSSLNASLAAEYFDGRSARAHAVMLERQGDTLRIVGDGVEQRVALSALRWPERQRHGVRRIELPDGGTVRCHDAAAFDAFARVAGVSDSVTVRLQQSWRGTLAAVALMVLLLAAGYRWGLPAAARAALAAVPPRVDVDLGESAYRSLGAWLLQPSEVPPERQAALQRTFASALQRAAPDAAVPRLRFHAAKRLGPNAFALPGGIIVVTDELLARLPGRDDVVLGVLAHEFGHVQQRHGMRLLVQTTLLGTVTSVAFGDFSTLLAGLPALLGQLAYSRDFEREADEQAIAVLRASGISPAVMVTLFDVLKKERGDGDPLGIAFSSHPADDERIARFRAAAR